MPIPIFAMLGKILGKASIGKAVASKAISAGATKAIAAKGLSSLGAKTLASKAGAAAMQKTAAKVAADKLSLSKLADPNVNTYPGTSKLSEFAEKAKKGLSQMQAGGQDPQWSEREGTINAITPHGMNRQGGSYDEQVNKLKSLQ